MVNIHVFDLNNYELSTPRGKLCLEETLKYQTNYKLYIWDLKSSEIQEMIANSKYCQEAYKYGRPMVSLFQYLKMEVLSRYGGWCIELDQVVETDLSQVFTMDYSKSYLVPTDNDKNYQIVTWFPIYVAKGLDISETLNLANTKYAEPFEYNEGLVCKVPASENIMSMYGLLYFMKFSHYVTPIFNELSNSRHRKYEVSESGTIKVTLFDYFSEGRVVEWELQNPYIFFEISKQFNTFDQVLPNMTKRGEIFISDEFKKLAKKFNIEFKE